MNDLEEFVLLHRIGSLMARSYLARGSLTETLLMDQAKAAIEEYHRLFPDVSTDDLHAITVAFGQPIIDSHPHT